ncbi:MAG: hypothetical protein PHE12_04045 [Clostridia bacterium]|nr:hypothetical protein [Clostridia bacterium]
MRYKIITYGCQMNVHDSEKIAGILSQLGYVSCQNTEEADVIVFNTCCIRESAERKAIGNIGSLKNLKKNNPDVIIAVCGCMTQAGETAQKLKEKFPFIDIIFGTHNLHCFKDYIIKRKQYGKKLIEIWPEPSKTFDNISILRNQKISAFVNIIYGCNNFCSTALFRM